MLVYRRVKIFFPLRTGRCRSLYITNLSLYKVTPLEDSTFPSSSSVGMEIQIIPMAAKVLYEMREFVMMDGYIYIHISSIYIYIHMYLFIPPLECREIGRLHMNSHLCSQFRVQSSLIFLCITCEHEG